MTTIEHTFTVRSAVEACGVSEKSLRRRLPALREHGATVDNRGRWTIPYSALRAIDLHPGKPAGPDAGHRDQDTDQVTSTFDQEKILADQLRDQADQAEILRLRGENDLLRQLLAAKDQALTLALRQLPPGALDQPAPAIVTEPATEVVSGDLDVIVDNTEPATETTAPKRGRWRKFFTGR